LLVFSPVWPANDVSLVRVALGHYTQFPVNSQDFLV
jgi:hypothetical protein